MIERGAMAFNCAVDSPATASVWRAEICDDVSALTCVLDSWLTSSSDQELTVELGSARIWAGLSMEMGDVMSIGLLFSNECAQKCFTGLHPSDRGYASQHFQRVPAQGLARQFVRPPSMTRF